MRVVPSRSASRSAVLSVILAGQPLERNHIVERTGLSRATVFRAVDDLRAQGAVRDVALAAPAGRGRPPTGVQLVGDARRACGVDLGGTNCRIVIADLLGRAVRVDRQRTPADTTGPELAAWILNRIDKISDDHGSLGGIAIGLPGALSGDATRVLGSQNLPQIVGARFISALREQAPAPVVVENDSNLALTGELRYGALPRDATVSLLAIGTGVGSAAAIGGQVLRTGDGRLGEFGRLNMPGSKLKLRDLVSGAGLIGYARECGVDIADPRELFATPDRYPGLYRQVVDAMTHLVAIVALAYEPRSILLTGGVSQGFGRQLIDRVATDVSEIVGVPINLDHSSLGDSSGLFGAMATALARTYTDLGVAAADLPRVEVDRDAVRGSLIGLTGSVEHG